ncbi:2-dehydro-3-deoxygalactonokinase [Krasilnikoviella flava]|uniref:2-dehydro-3-deoxygalactonokinase n=1 Tax=Krasilnikoviella flava TaxID=526729 RepID=A0A1T5ID75_9MICO|nr:2-dehydro-3-deoxygalactonokinase [Krasilnikoviella flava]SKC37146.1 2-dehydro-3-deoxygalactonokinase [Krasilnikoviella flava]
MADDAPRRDAALVALDWGTSAFRGWLLDGSGRVLDGVRSGDGSLRTSAGAGTAAERAAAFGRAFERLCGGWLAAHPGAPVLCAGMAGSDHGWAEAGYLDVPGPLDGLARHLTAVPARDAGGADVRLVPGLRVAGELPDVMRGEEVQLLGALEDGEDRPVAVVLPGTHAKWVRLDGAGVAGFATVMTGEVYDLLRRDSILARLARGEPGPVPSDAFVRGLDVDAEHGDERGVLALLFTARTLVMTGRLGPEDVADYVSGLLVGSEVRHGLRSLADGPVAVCGSGSTTPRYRLALERRGRTVRAVPEDVAARGLWRVAVDAGLVAGPSAPTPILEDQP